MRTLVDHVPGHAPALVMRHHRGDMLLHGLDERVVGPRAPRNYISMHRSLPVSPASQKQNIEAGGKPTPAWQLLVPDQIMASQFLSICFCQMRNDIARFEAELPPGRFGCIPLVRQPPSQSTLI